MKRCVFGLVVVIFAFCLTALAADEFRWGIVAGGGRAVVPQTFINTAREIFVFREFEGMSVKGFTVSSGLTHFNKNGSPSYSIVFSRTDLALLGTRNIFDGTVRTLDGSGAMNGAMFLKHLNFVSRPTWSGGMSFGGGGGKLSAVYVTTDVRGGQRTIERDSIQKAVPLFEVVGRLDFHPARNFSFGPEFGVRNFTFVWGGTARVHF